MALLEETYETDVNDKELPLDEDIIWTQIVAEDSRKKVGSTLGRAAIGAAILGPVGLLAGATGKNSRTTTFVVKTKYNTQDTITVYTDSIAFKKLCKHLR